MATMAIDGNDGSIEHISENDAGPDYYEAVFSWAERSSMIKQTKRAA